MVKLNEEGRNAAESWLYRQLRHAIQKQSTEQVGDKFADTGVVDALANILHICDEFGLDFADCERQARNHYVEEIEVTV